MMSCPLCQEQETTPLFVKEERSFTRCHRCHLIYQDPPPSNEDREEHYREGYYESFGPRVDAIHQGRLSLYENVLKACSRYRRTGRLLDIGSGFGDFLDLAQDRGWEVWGIEPSRQAAESAQKRFGNRVLNQTVETADFPENHFDVITLWNVIDCLPDSLESLRRIHRWLSPQGLLFIRTPNAAFHLALFRFYKQFEPYLKKLGWEKEASVFLRANFDARALARLLSEAGFSGICIRNGTPTRGDAYQVFSRSALMTIGKLLTYTLAEGLAFLTGHRILIGSNLLAQASKGPAPSAVQTFVSRSRVFLKSIFLHLLAVAGYLLGFPVWRKLRRGDHEIRILLYHSVNDSQRSDMSVQPSQFEKQLDFLVRNYEVTTLENAVQCLRSKKLPARPAVVLTFDDGYEDNFRVAYPHLKRRNLPATIFLLTGEREEDRKASHLAYALLPDDRLLSWDAVKEMAASGITFGSHGQTHARLTELDPERLRREIFLSKERIEFETNRPVQFFSYPYGTDCDFDQGVKSLVREAGYEAGFSALFGTNGPGSDLWTLRRIGIEASDTLFTLQAKLNGALGLLSLFNFSLLRRFIRRLDSFFLRPGPPSRKEPPLLLVSVDFPPHTDGVSTISRQISEQMVRQGKEVLVIGPRSHGDREFDRSQPYRIFRVAGYEWGYLRFLPFLYWMPYLVWRLRIRKVLAMNIAYGGVLSWLLSHVISLEYLIFAYGYEFEKVKQIPFIRFLYQKIYGRAKKIVACSNLVRSRLILFGVPPEKIQVLYPAVDFEKYAPRPLPAGILKEKGLDNRKILLTVGRLIDRKGHDQVIRALPEVCRVFPDILYCIVGVGPSEEKLRHQVRSLNLEDHVRFLGEVPEEELVTLYNACKVFVMPSREIQKEGHIEGFGIVYLEANACGKPVIGGKSGGVSEAIRDGETGFLVDPNRPDEIAGKILFLLSHPEQAERIGRQGLKWVREKFHWNLYADTVYQILHEKRVLPTKRESPLLLVSVDFPPHTDGISTAAGELCERIARRGKHIMAIGPRSPGDFEFDLSQPYRIFRVPGYDWGYLRFVPLLFATLYVVFRYRVKKIFAMSVTYGGVLSWALSFFIPLKYIVFAHGYEFEKVKGISPLRKFYLKIYGRSSGIQVNSQATRQKLVAFGVPPEKIRVIYAAANLDRYHPREVPGEYLKEKNLEGRKILLTVGRLIQRKGHDQVLRALPRVLKDFPELVYCIVGIGPHERTLRREAGRLHLEDHVRFLGKVSEEELLILYNACQIFVMPSREMAERGHIEGFGLVYLEANACGKPVIGGRSGGIAEALQDQETGFLVDPTRPDEIAEKILFLLSHPEEGERIGRQGLKWVRERFHWDRYVEPVYEMLQGEPLP